MSNTNRTDVLAWMANVEALAAELARPIEGTSDPRYVALVERFGATAVEGIDFEELGSNYFEHFAYELLPAPPFPRPEWAKSHTYDLDDYPNLISVEFQGAKWDTGSGDPLADGPEASAQVIDSFSIIMIGHDRWAAGDVIADGMQIEFGYLEPKYPNGATGWCNAGITVNSARALQIALADALHGLPFD